MEAVIQLSDAALPKITIGNNGAEHSYTTNHDQLIRLLEAASKQAEPKPITTTVVKRNVFHSPALPPNTVKYAQDNKGSSYFFITLEETAVDLKYHTSTFIDVPYPKMVIGFEVDLSNERLHQVVLAAYKDKFLREDTQLYHFPYSNVYQSGGICYYDSTPVKDLVSLQTWFHRWVSVTNNDHMYFQNKTNTLNLPLREVFESTQGQDFNYDMLQPMNRSFKSFSDRFMSIRDNSSA